MLLISMTSASITISQPESIYNLGDTIYTTITINPSEIEGNFELNLICGNSSETFYKISPAESAFTINQETKINHKIILEKQYLGDLIGECQIRVNLGETIANTDKFRISSDISVTATLDNEFYDPGETITLNIDATKPNGKKLEGFVKITGLVNVERQIIDGKIKETVVTDKNLEGGEYILTLSVFDKDKNGNILNLKNTEVNFKINQIATSVPLTLASLETNPGEKIEFQADIFDQSGNVMEGSILVEFISSIKEKIQLNVQSGETGSIELAKNATAGNWKIYSSYGKIKEERTIKVNSVPLLDFNFLENSSVLVIKNIGNADFIGTVNIEISDESKNLSLNIKPGEERMFTLSAPTGEHDIRVEGGEGMLEKRLLLTGKAIDIKDYGKFLVFSEYPAVWSIIITLIILLGIAIFFRYNKKTFGLSRKFKEKISKMRDMKSDSSGEQIIDKEKRSNLNSAEASLVIKGTKEPSTIITLKIKNEPKQFVRDNLEKNLKELAEKNSAAIDFTKGEIFIIFSPRKTRSYKNEYSAIKFALELKSLIQESNRKFNDRIEFGIGINSGDLISAIEKEKLKYTGIDGTISYSKKIADISNQEVIISEKVKNKLLRELRTEKIEQSGNTYYKVLRISEREENQEKLKDLLKRTHLDN